MPVVNFGERWSAREIDTTQKESEWTSQVSYIATTGTDNESHWTVYEYASLNGPAEDGVLVRADLSVLQISARRYYCLYTFVHPNSEESKQDKTSADAAEASFTTVGGTLSVTTSLETLYAATGDGAIVADSDKNFKRALNVDPETKKPTAVDIVHGQFGYTEVKVFDDPIPCASVQAWSLATPTTNNAAWRCFAAGEVLFRGVTGARRGTGDWELTFNFSVQHNLAGLTYPDPVPADANQVIGPYEKRGWEYEWIYFYKWTDPQAQPGQEQPSITRPAVYIERMYNESDFSLLGLG